MSPTDKVRIKSLISSTRVAAVDSAEKSGYSPPVMDLSDDEDDEPTASEEEMYEDHDKVSVGLAKMYQQTLELLGDTLG